MAFCGFTSPLYLIELWVQGLLLYCCLMFGFLVHIWLQVSGIITDRWAEGREKLWVQLEAAGLGIAFCPQRDIPATPPPFILIIGFPSTTLWQRWVVGYSRSSEWFFQNLYFPGINHRAPSILLGKRISLVSAGLVFTKLTFLTRKTFLAELISCLNIFYSRFIEI